MNKKQLMRALNLVKQNTHGNKKDLRNRLLFFRNILVIPSDVSSNSSGDESEFELSPKTKKKKKAKSNSKSTGKAKSKATPAAAKSTKATKNHQMMMKPMMTCRIL